jgi:hypothetical protein
MFPNLTRHDDLQKPRAVHARGFFLAHAVAKPEQKPPVSASTEMSCLFVGRRGQASAALLLIKLSLTLHVINLYCYVTAGVSTAVFSSAARLYCVPHRGRAAFPGVANRHRSHTNENPTTDQASSVPRSLTRLSGLVGRRAPLWFSSGRVRSRHRLRDHIGSIYPAGKMQGYLNPNAKGRVR